MGYRRVLEFERSREDGLKRTSDRPRPDTILDSISVERRAFTAHLQQHCITRDRKTSGRVDASPEQPTEESRQCTRAAEAALETQLFECQIPTIAQHVAVGISSIG
jgi:hypothetical protein